jgi:hypothetical protein
MRIQPRGGAYSIVVFFALAVAAFGCAVPTESTPVNGSRFVFFEDFPSKNPRQWNVQSLSDGSRTFLAGGSYHIVRSHPGTMRGWPLQVTVPSGFQFNAKFQLAKGQDAYEGIAFWDDLANRFMLFAVTADGNAGLFRHGRTGYSVLVDWRPVASIHRGVGAMNTLTVNMDRVSAAEGRTFLINGVPLGRPCDDAWRKAAGVEPAVPPRGLFVGAVAGSYKGSTAVNVLRASMYDGSNAGPVPACPATR